VNSAGEGGNDCAVHAHPDAPSAGTLPEDVTSVLRPLESVGLTRSSGAKRVGGKAASLGRLTRDGFPVPPGWVLDARHFVQLVDERLPRGHDATSLIKIAGTRAGIDRAARARDRILGEPLPSDLRGVLDALWNTIAPDAPWGLSVRSSATCEDASGGSLAGLATTILGVRGGEALEKAIRQVWASLFLPRTLAYLSHAGVREVAMPVLLQIMVPAKAAGVMFTGPPPGMASDRWPSDERLTNVTLGLGAPVVDGAAATDTIRFNLRGEIVEQIIAQKREALEVGPEGVISVEVPADRARRPALSESMISELGVLATRLETSSSGALDVEFAVHVDERGQEHLALLQARPLTGGTYPDGGDAETVWSRANVGEALPGAATPLTWSIAQSFSDHGFREAFSALGCRVPKGVVLVANVYGRFYLNLTAFMQIAGQVPGLRPATLLGMSGGASADAIEMLERQTSHVKTRRFLMRAPFVGPRLLARYARLPAEVDSFEERAEKSRRALVELDLALLPDDALATTLDGARSLLDETGGLMLSCASGSLSSHLALRGVLKRVVRRASKRENDPSVREDDSLFSVEPLVQALIGGIAEVDSASPGVALLRVAQIALDDDEASQLLMNHEVSDVTSLPPGPTRRAFDHFLHKFGDRAVREAELATPRWEEDPASLLKMLVSVMHGGVRDPDEALARARALADQKLAHLETHISSVELALVRKIIESTQRFTRLREHMRTWVTRVLGMLRRIALDVDRRLRRIDPSLPEGSVFFCTYDELSRALRSGRAEVGHVVRLRQAEHLRDCARPDPPPTFIGRPPPVTLPPAAGPRWTGLAASGGVVEGRARVLPPGIVDLDAVQPGEILVSRTTDVGLSPLFLVAAAIVTELGGPLSHAAIVAREYGVPAVVNVGGATLTLQTGDLIRVDGDRGIVEKLDEPEASAPGSSS